MLKILLFLNNYLHDFFAALLLVSGVAAYLFYRTLPQNPHKETAEYFIKVYQKILRLGWTSFFLTVFLGIPRTLSYQTIEWSKDMGSSQIALLVMKHAVLFFIVASGMFSWMKLNKKVKQLRNEVQEEKIEQFVRH